MRAGRNVRAAEALANYLLTHTGLAMLCAKSKEQATQILSILPRCYVERVIVITP